MSSGAIEEPEEEIERNEHGVVPSLGDKSSHERALSVSKSFV